MNGVEKLAKAIYERSVGDPWWQASDEERERYLLYASVSFDFFRQPTPAMVGAGLQEMKRRDWPIPAGYVSKLWVVMAGTLDD